MAAPSRVPGRLSSHPLFPALLRALSTSAPFQSSAVASDSAPASLLEVDVTPQLKKRRRNLMDVLWKNPNWGVGCRVAKRHWQEGTFYEITEVRINKSGRTGTAWGIYHENGAPVSPVSRLGGTNKPCWKQVKEFMEGEPSSEGKQEQSQQKLAQQ